MPKIKGLYMHIQCTNQVDKLIKFQGWFFTFALHYGCCQHALDLRLFLLTTSIVSDYHLKGYNMSYQCWNQMTKQKSTEFCQTLSK